MNFVIDYHQSLRAGMHDGVRFSIPLNRVSYGRRVESAGIIFGALRDRKSKYPVTLNLTRSRRRAILVTLPSKDGNSTYHAHFNVQFKF